MNCFLLLLIIYMAYSLISFAISGGKLINPSFVFSISFTFMIGLAYLYRNILGFEVSLKTFLIFIIGGMIFLFCEFLAKHIISKLKLSKNSFHTYQLNENNFEPLLLNNTTQNLLVVFMIGSLLLSVYVLLKNTSDSGIGSRMSELKELLLTSPGAIKYRFILSQLYKINTAIVYFCAYIMVYNIVACNSKVRSQKKYIILICLFIVFSMVAQAARQPAIEIILFLPIVYVSLRQKRQDKKRIIKLIRKAIPYIGLAVVAFYYTSTLVGRRKTKRGILEYFAVYFCGGLYSFNLHVDEPSRNLFWGQSSFADIYNILIKLGIVPREANMQYHTFDLYGNTVTMFGRWFEDFGCVGVYTMTAIVSIFFATFFYKFIVGKKDNISNKHVERILYCKFLISLVWAGYDDRIRALLSAQTIVHVVLIYMLYNLFLKKKGTKSVGNNTLEGVIR